MFWSMCTLKQGPQILPVSYVLLGVTIVVDIVLSAAFSRSAIVVFSKIAGVADMPPYRAVSFAADFGMVIVSLIILAALIYVLLLLMNKQQRTYHTLFALFGTSCILTAFMLLINWIGAASLLLWALCILTVGIWSLVVAGHILAKAMDSTLTRGILAFIGIVLVQFLISAVIFGPAEGLAVPTTPSTT